MYKSILVPLDGSERAEAILPCVEGEARLHQAKVIFLQVVKPEFTIPDDAPQPSLPETSYPTVMEKFEQRTREAETYLANLVEDFRQKGLQAEKLVAHGSVVETIIKIAERHDVSLIAMASHGRSGLARVFYGSVAAGVLHQVTRPLLLVRSFSGQRLESGAR